MKVTFISFLFALILSQLALANSRKLVLINGNNTKEIRKVGNILHLDWNDFESVKKPYQEFLLQLKKFPEQESLVRKAFIDALLEFQKKPEYQKLIDNFDLNRSEREKLSTPFLKAYDQWFELFAIYNRFVPGMFPEYRPIGYKRSLKIAKDGKEIIAHLEKIIEEQLPTTGYKTMDDFRKALYKTPEGMLALDFFQNEKVEFAIRRPEGARFWLDKTGFQNQRVTGSSKGSMDPVRRDNLESKLTRIPLNKYEKLDVELKPKYGALFPKPSEGFTSDPKKNDENLYGSDLWILKAETKSNITLVSIDSFRWNEIPIEKPINAWNQVFIPWKYRELLAPYLIDAFSKSKNLKEFSPSEKLHGFKMNNQARADYYYEFQVWKDLTLNDVEALVFTVNPPDVEAVKTLRSYGIKIYDHRGDVRVEWNGEK